MTALGRVSPLYLLSLFFLGPAQVSAEQLSVCGCPAMPPCWDVALVTRSWYLRG